MMADDKNGKETVNLYPMWEGPRDSSPYSSKLNKKRCDLEEVVFGPPPPPLTVMEELKH